jgi:hypothetical protein
LGVCGPEEDSGRNELFFGIIEEDWEAGENLLEPLQQLPSPGDGTQSDEAMLIDTFLEDRKRDSWWPICKTITDGDPVAAKELYMEWTHENLAVEYLEKMKQIYNQMDDDL